MYFKVSPGLYRSRPSSLFQNLKAHGTQHRLATGLIMLLTTLVAYIRKLSETRNTSPVISSY